jgi:hypothetical protein
LARLTSEPKTSVALNLGTFWFTPINSAKVIFSMH